MSHVHDALTAWRAAERELEDTTDPRAIEELSVRVAYLRELYRSAVDDTSGHGAVSEADEGS
jgi:hypothetical protein